MANLDECISTGSSILSITYAEVFSEVIHFCTCALLGVISLQVLRVLAPRMAQRPPAPKVVEEAADEAVHLFASLPVDIAASIATFVNVADLAQLGVASETVRARCWEPAQVWTALAAERRLQSAMPLPTDPVALREWFRMAYFRLERNGPSDVLARARAACGRDWPVRVLDEAGHMMSGLMPRDGEATAAQLYDAAEAAFQAHDVLSESAARVAEAFLTVARRRSDLLGRWQVRHLEEVRRTQHCLEATMGIAMKRFFADLPEVQAEARGFWEESTEQSNQFHVYLPELEDAEYDAMHEAEFEAQFVA